MNEYQQREIIDWLDRIERDLHRVQMVLLTTMGCVVGLTATIVLEMM